MYATSTLHSVSKKNIKRGFSILASLLVLMMVFPPLLLPLEVRAGYGAETEGAASGSSGPEAGSDGGVTDNGGGGYDPYNDPNFTYDGVTYWPVDQQNASSNVSGGAMTQAEF